MECRVATTFDWEWGPSTLARIYIYIHIIWHLESIECLMCWLCIWTQVHWAWISEGAPRAAWLSKVGGWKWEVPQNIGKNWENDDTTSNLGIPWGTLGSDCCLKMQCKCFWCIILKYGNFSVIDGVPLWSEKPSNIVQLVGVHLAWVLGCS